MSRGQTMTLGIPAISVRAPHSAVRGEAAPWTTLIVAALAVFVVWIDTTVLFVAFPSIRRTFPDVSATGLSWILNAYTIVYAAMLVPAGRLADRVGRRAMFLAAMSVFTLGSLFCGIAPGVPTMIAARVVQALGAAALMPASLALVIRAFPAERRGMAVGVWGTAGALASALGPAAGAAIVQCANWRWAFFLNLPIGGLCLLLGVRALQESRSEERGPMPDPLGTTLLIGALGALSYSIVGARSEPRAPLYLVAGAVALLLFVWRSLRVKNPALDLRLFTRRNFAVANAVSLFYSTGFAAVFFGGVLFLTEHWHLSIIQAGLWLTPAPVAVIPVALLASKYAHRIGYRALFVSGGLAFVAGGGLLLVLPLDEPRFFTSWLPISVVLGIAIGQVVPSLGGASSIDLDSTTFAAGGAVNQAIRQVGAVLGVALVLVLIGQSDSATRFDPMFPMLIVVGALTAIGGLLLPARRSTSS